MQVYYSTLPATAEDTLSVRRIALRLQIEIINYQMGLHLTGHHMAHMQCGLGSTPLYIVSRNQTARVWLRKTKTHCSVGSNTWVCSSPLNFSPMSCLSFFHSVCAACIASSCFFCTARSWVLKSFVRRSRSDWRRRKGRRTQPLNLPSLIRGEGLLKASDHNILVAPGSFLSAVSVAALRSVLWRSPVPSPSPPSHRAPVAQQQVSTHHG